VKPLLGGKIGGPTGIPHNAWLRWRSYRSERIRAASKWEIPVNITRGTLRSRIHELGITIQQAVQVEARTPSPTDVSPAMEGRFPSAVVVP
jgi:hypothetical protein